MDEFDKNVIFSVAMRNIARAIEKMQDGLHEQEVDGNEQLIEYEDLICDNLIDFLMDFLPNACVEINENEGEEDEEENGGRMDFCK